jgi:hypothetical protein
MKSLRNIVLLLAFGVLAFLKLPLDAQIVSRHQTVSSDPLTADQISIYRAAISDYLRGSSDKLNIASTTESPDQGPFFDYRCMKRADGKGTSAHVVHKLDSLVAGNPQLVLVQRHQQEQQIQGNDPQKVVKRSIDDHEEVSDKELDKSIKKAFETGLFTLSEIVFDKQHKHAVVAYSFVCGGLCGNGNTLLLEKVGKNWKISKSCGGWVS